MKKLSKLINLFVKYAKAFEGNCEKCGTELKLGIAEPYSSLCIKCEKEKEYKAQRKMFGFEEEKKIEPQKEEKSSRYKFLTSILQTLSRTSPGAFNRLTIGPYEIIFAAGKGIVGCAPTEDFDKITDYSEVRLRLYDFMKKKAVDPRADEKLNKFDWVKYWNDFPIRGEHVPIEVVIQILTDLQKLDRE